MSALYTVNQTGKPAGVLGRSRRDIDPGTITVNCPDTHSTYLWEILSEPSGGTPANIVSPTAQTTDITVNERGGYKIRLTVDAGTGTEDLDVRYIGVRLYHSKKAIPALDETIEDNSTAPYDGSRGAEEKVTEFFKWIDDNIDIRGGVRRRAVLSYVDCTAAPPTEVDGDRYILDDTVGTVHADWDGASKLDIVQYDNELDTWNAETPEEGWVAYVDDTNKDMLYVDDGTPAWELEGGLVLFENDPGAGNPGLTTRRTVFNNSATGDYSTSAGQLSETPAKHTWARGYRSKANWVGQDAYSSRLDAAAAGNAQRTEAGLHGSTSDGSQTDTLTLDNASAELTLQNNFVYSCQFNVVAKYDNSAFAQVAAWVGEFLVVVNNAGTVTLVGKNINKYANTTDLYEDEWLLDVTVSSTKIEIGVDQGSNQGGTVLWEGYIKIAELLADYTE